MSGNGLCTVLTVYVVRGGSWNHDRDDARVAFRNGSPDDSSDIIGFRLVSPVF